MTSAPEYALGEPRYECPICREEITSLGMDFDGGVPSTWNDCCSPECGWRMDGVVDVLSEDSEDHRVQQWRWNEWQQWKLIYEEADRQRACEHEWKLNGGRMMQTRFGATFEDTTDQDFELLICAKCNANKAGEPLGEPRRMGDRIRGIA